MIDGPDYCGCCGVQCRGEFCTKCKTPPKHLAPASLRLHAWDRTWFAQHGEDCPFQVKGTE